MRTLFTWLLAGLLAAGCAAPIREPEPEAPPETTRTQPTGSPAVVALAGDARAALSGGRLDQAAQLLERAIRIEPQNGALWHELARVRFEQGSYEQAGQLAARSNALLGAGSALRARNDELMEAARNALEH